MPHHKTVCNCAISLLHHDYNDCSML